MNRRRVDPDGVDAIGGDDRCIAPARDARTAGARRRAREHRPRRVPVGGRVERCPDRDRRHRDVARVGGPHARSRLAGARIPATQAPAAGLPPDDRHRHRVRRVHELLAIRPDRAHRHDEPERRRRQRVPADRAGAATGDGARLPTHGAVRPLQLDRHVARRGGCGAGVPSGMGEPTVRRRRHHRAPVRLRACMP